MKLYYKISIALEITLIFVIIALYIYASSKGGLSTITGIAYSIMLFVSTIRFVYHVIKLRGSTPE